VFVLCQSAMFAGLFTGFSLAFDFESGFARRLMLAAEDRRGIALGYALVALTRAAITLTVVTAVALAAGMRITGDGVDIVRPVRPGGAARARRLRLGGRRGVPLPLDPGRAR
jgi:ABC-2 type transport system permease protein